MNEGILKERELGARCILRCYKARWGGKDVLVEEGEARRIKPLLKDVVQKFGVWQNLSHPHLLKFLGVQEVEQRIYFIYEWKEGQPLNMVLKGNRPLEVTQALSLATQIAEVLNYLHQNGISSGYVSPASFLVSSDGSEIYLMDWVGETVVKKAIVRAGGDLPDRCFHYAAPEVFSAREPIPASDWFSIACLFFQFLTGVHPFSDQFGRPSLDAMVRGDLLARDLLEELPGGIRFLIQPIISFEISQRTISPQEWIGAVKVLQAEFASRRRPALLPKTSHFRLASFIVLLGMAGFTIFIILRILLTFFPQFTKGLVVVPDLSGMDEVSAMGKLAPLSLILQIQAQEFSNEMPKGKILHQNPPPGKRVAKNSKVSVTISRGRAVTRMPQVTDLNLQEARKKLENLGLKINIRYAYSDMPKDWVLQQYPSPGTELRVDSEVVLTLSTGGEEVLIPVPDVVGLAVDTAVEKLLQAGFEVTGITLIHRQRLEGDRVLEQNPMRDSLAPIGSPILLKAERAMNSWGSFVLVLPIPSSTEFKRLILYLKDFEMENILEDRRVKGGFTLVKQVSFRSDNAELRAEWDSKILRKIVFVKEETNQRP